MVDIPKFTQTKDDIGKEIRERKDKLNSLNFDYEFLQRKVEEYKNWIESSFGGAEKFFKEVAEEVERDEKLISEKLNAKNAEIRVASDTVASLETQKDNLKKEVSALKTDKSKQDTQLTSYSEEVNNRIEVLDNQYEELKAKVADLNSEKGILDDKLEKGTSEIDARREVLREWSDKLHQKERDIRLWEIRVKRKVKDNFPSIGEIKI